MYACVYMYVRVCINVCVCPCTHLVNAYVHTAIHIHIHTYIHTYRGVYFAPSLPDGEFRQYAVLPLSLFSVGDSSKPASAQSGLTAPATRATGAESESESGRGKGANMDFSKLLEPLKGTLDALGAKVSAVFGI
jgi:hypothetical protein